MSLGSRISSILSRFEGYRDFVIAMLPGLDHLDGSDVEHGERIRAVQRLEELRPLIAAQEEEHRSRRRPKAVCISSLNSAEISI